MGRRGGLRKVRGARAARLLTGRSGSSPPRAAGELQLRPGHDSPAAAARRELWGQQRSGGCPAAHLEL